MNLRFLTSSVNLPFIPMLMIRLQRTGRKHEPTFRVVLTDSKNGPKSGKYLKNLGWYDTRLKNKATEQLDVEQIKKYMANGAKLSLTLHNFLISQKIIEGKKLNALPKKTVQKKAEPVDAKKAEKVETSAAASESSVIPELVPEAVVESAPGSAPAPESPATESGSTI